MKTQEELANLASRVEGGLRQRGNPVKIIYTPAVNVSLRQLYEEQITMDEFFKRVDKIARINSLMK